MATRDTHILSYGDDGDIISVDQAENLFKRSRAKIAQWVTDGDISGYSSKGDPRLLVSKSEIAALISPSKLGE